MRKLRIQIVMAATLLALFSCNITDFPRAMEIEPTDDLLRILKHERKSYFADADVSSMSSQWNEINDHLFLRCLHTINPQLDRHIENAQSTKPKIVRSQAIKIYLPSNEQLHRWIKFYDRDRGFNGPFTQINITAGEAGRRQIEQLRKDHPYLLLPGDPPPPGWLTEPDLEDNTVPN